MTKETSFFWTAELRFLSCFWHVRGSYLKGSTLVGKPLKIDNRQGFARTDIEVRADPTTASGNVTIEMVTENGCMSFAYLNPPDNHPTDNSHTPPPAVRSSALPYQSQVRRTDRFYEAWIFSRSGCAWERFAETCRAGNEKGGDRVPVEPDGWTRLTF